jgi:hypothetical protein
MYDFNSAGRQGELAVQDLKPTFKEFMKEQSNG